MLGVSLVTLTGCSWLFALPAHIGGHVDNPYIGVLVFLIIPVVFFAGLALIPIGVALAKRRVEGDLAFVQNRRAAWRRLAIFFLAGTVVNVIVGSQLTYRAVAYMETPRFCGPTCHVMNPEFTAWSQTPPHQKVECVSCHVTPGASGWVQSKIAGTRQLVDVIFNSYPRPIESAMEDNRVPSSAETCEQCHAREMFIGPRLRIITQYEADEANTRMETVLMMQVGGGRFGGIHGMHMGPGVHIRYAAQDKKRQTIPWVEYRNAATGVTRTYLADGAKPDAVSTLPTFEMQCVDCHNRAAHAFDVPENAVDEAMVAGRIAADLPFVKKTGVELIKAVYRSADEAGQKIPSGLDSFYRGKYPDLASKRASEIQAAGETLLTIYRRNVFPDLKVTWGTYVNNLGHTDYPGCFRCHDGGHSTAGNKTIPQDCSTCHRMLAVEQTAPVILKTLGVTDTLTGLE